MVPASQAVYSIVLHPSPALLKRRRDSERVNFSSFMGRIAGIRLAANAPVVKIRGSIKKAAWTASGNRYKMKRAEASLSTFLNIFDRDFRIALLISQELRLGNTHFF